MRSWRCGTRWVGRGWGSRPPCWSVARRAWARPGCWRSSRAGPPTAAARVLVGQCLELGEAGLPFAPFAAALRAVLRADGPEVFAGYEAEFAPLLPELGRALRGADRPPCRPAQRRPARLPVRPGRRAVPAARRRPPAGADHRGPALGRPFHPGPDRLPRSGRRGRAGCCWSAPTAPTSCSAAHPLRPFLAELDRARGVERVELGRLDRDGTAAILADLLGAEPPARAVDDVHGRTQGNPFFIEELAVAGDPIGCAALPRDAARPAAGPGGPAPRAGPAGAADRGRRRHPLRPRPARRGRRAARGRAGGRATRRRRRPVGGGRPGR